MRDYFLGNSLPQVNSVQVSRRAVDSVSRNTDKGIMVRSTRFNSPSLNKCMQVTPVNTNSG